MNLHRVPIGMGTTVEVTVTYYLASYYQIAN